MSGIGVVALKTPAAPRRMRAEVYLPPNAPARQITLLLDGREIASKAVPGSGSYTVASSGPVSGETAELRVDRTFRAPGDQRDLGLVLIGIGFVR